MQLSQKHPKPGKIEPFSYYLEILAHTWALRSIR